jgi:Glycosyltransferases involved in cell wall biogenesis
LSLVSVVIPVLNERPVLPRCLDSVLGQTYSDLEVLTIVDKRSADGSLDLCHDYAARDKRVKVFRDPGNVSTARNKGLAEASGEYLQFTDADDSISPEFTATMVGAIVREKADQASCGAVFTDEGGKAAESGKPVHQANSLGRFTAGEWLTRLADPANLAHFGMCWNKLYRMAVIRDKGLRFDPGMTFAEDHIFNLDYLAACESVWIGNEPLYNYIEGSGPDGQLVIRKFHPQAADFVDLFCRKLVRTAAPYCSAKELSAIQQAAVGLIIVSLIRFCRRDSKLSREETLAKLAEITDYPDVREWFAAYCPGSGHSRLVPFFFRHGWIRPLYYAARRRADKRYGIYYAPATS